MCLLFSFSGCQFDVHLAWEADTPVENGSSPLCPGPKRGEMDPTDRHCELSKSERGRRKKTHREEEDSAATALARHNSPRQAFAYISLHPLYSCSVQRKASPECCCLRLCNTCRVRVHVLQTHNGEMCTYTETGPMCIPFFFLLLNSAPLKTNCSQIVLRQCKFLLPSCSTFLNTCVCTRTHTTKVVVDVHSGFVGIPGLVRTYISGMASLACLLFPPSGIRGMGRGDTICLRRRLRVRRRFA